MRNPKERKKIKDFTTSNKKGEFMFQEHWLNSNMAVSSVMFKKLEKKIQFLWVRSGDGVEK